MVVVGVVVVAVVVVGVVVEVVDGNRCVMVHMVH